MPIFGKSKIGDSCFIDSTALIGYPRGAELNLLKENPDKIEGCEIGNDSSIRPFASGDTISFPVISGNRSPGDFRDANFDS